MTDLHRHFIDGLTITSQKGCTPTICRSLDFDSGFVLQVTDLHRHYIDGLTIPSQKGGLPLQRILSVQHL